MPVVDKHSKQPQMKPITNPKIIESRNAPQSTSGNNRTFNEVELVKNNSKNRTQSSKETDLHISTSSEGFFYEEDFIDENLSDYDNLDDTTD